MAQKAVAITGASAGIGRAAARAFAARGCKVGLIARGTDRLEATCREVDAAGGRGIAAPADVSDPEAVDRAAEHIERNLGPIDVWVNAAMATVFAPFHLIARRSSVATQRSGGIRHTASMARPCCWACSIQSKEAGASSCRAPGGGHAATSTTAACWKRSSPPTAALSSSLTG